MDPTLVSLSITFFESEFSLFLPSYCTTCYVRQSVTGIGSWCSERRAVWTAAGQARQWPPGMMTPSEATTTSRPWTRPVTQTRQPLALTFTGLGGWELGLPRISIRCVHTSRSRRNSISQSLATSFSPQGT